MSNKGLKLPKPKKPNGKGKGRGAKTQSWTLPTVLGLILSAVGALGIIALRPQLALSPAEPLSTMDPFSAPFELMNTGYVGLHVNHIQLFSCKVRINGGGVLDHNSFGQPEWDNFDLPGGATKTVITDFTKGFPVEQAEILILVQFKYFGITQTSSFRFVGVHRDNWRWTKQPEGNCGEG
jgi:hypothetical protein